MHRLTRYPAGRFRTEGSLALAAAPDRPSRLAPAPEPTELERITRLLVEVLAGARAPRQLGGHTTDRLLLALTRRPLPAHPRGTRSAAPRLRSWRMQSPWPGVAEVTAVARSYGRCHALALRFEFLGGRWLCTAIETTLPRP